MTIDHSCHHINIELYCITAESSVNVLSLIKCRSYWLSPVASVRCWNPSLWLYRCC